MFVLISPAFAQLSVFNTNASNFPIVSANFYVYGTDGKPLYGFSESNFKVSEYGEQKTILDVSCPLPPEPLAISSVLSIDISSSMLSGGPRIDFAQAAAKLWIDGLPENKSECGITSFNHLNFINSDLLFCDNINKTTLRSKVNGLSPWGGTDYNEALLNTSTGAIHIVKNGIFKRVIVFLTDGVPSIPPRESEIINQAIANNIEIYCVTLGMPAPQSLRNITSATGGTYFENINSLEDALNAYKSILFMVQGYKPCTITWQSQACSTDWRVADISLNNVLDAQTGYAPPKYAMSYISLPLGNTLSLGCVPKDSVKEGNLSIKAEVSSFDINSITSSNNLYSIIDWGGTAPPFTLAKDETRTLKIKYSAADSGYTNTIFTINSTACTGETLYANAGCEEVPPPEPTLKLTFPNGGERLMPCTDTTITWEGVTPKDTVVLEYSTDGGNSWNLISDSAANLAYKWKIPHLNGSNFQMRVKQRPLMFVPGNDTSYFIGNGRIRSIALSPDETKLAVLLWGGRVVIYDTKDYSVISEWDYKDHSLYTLSWSSGGSKLLLFNREFMDWKYDDVLICDTQNYYFIIADAINGSIINTINYTPLVSSIAWSSNDSLFAITNNGSNQISVYDSLGNYLMTLAEHTQAVNSLCWSTANNQLISGGNDGLVIAWNLLTRLPDKTFNLKKPILSMALSHRNSTYAISFKDSLQIFNNDFNNVIFDTIANTNNLKWSTDDKSLFFITGDTVAYLEVASKNIISIIESVGSYLNQYSYLSKDTSILLASDSGYIKSVNIFTRLDKKVIDNYTGSVESIAWSPDGSKLAVLFADKNRKSYSEFYCYLRSPSRKLQVWDITSNSILYELNDSKNYYYSIKWANDGSKIGAIKNRNSIQFFDGISYKELSYIDHISSLDFAWLKDSQRIIASQGDTLKLLDLNGNTHKSTDTIIPYIQSIKINSNEDVVAIRQINIGGEYLDAIKVIDISELKSINTTNNWCYSDIGLSPHGDEISFGGNENDGVSIWNFINNSFYNKAWHYPCWFVSGSTFFSASAQDWNYKRNVLATCDKIGYTFIFKNNDIYPTIQFNLNRCESSNPALAANWAPVDDKILLATGHWDGRIRIASLPSLQEYPQSDLSDAPWSIISPAIASQDVTLGTVNLGGMPIDTIIPAFVRNGDALPVYVDTMLIIGDTLNEFTITSGSPPYTLQPGENKDIEVNFTPKTIGTKTVTICIVTGCDTIKQILTADAIERSIEVAVNVIDFGRHRLGSPQIDTVAMVVKNTGSVPVNFTAASLKGPDNIQFGIDSTGTLPYSLPAGDSIQMKLHFKPLTAGKTSSVLSMDFEGSDPFITVLLLGDVYDQPQISTTNAHDFGEMTCNTTPREFFVVVNNTGGDSLVVSSASIEGTDAADFRVEGFTRKVIRRYPDSIKVVFDPQTYGYKHAQLVLTSNSEYGTDSLKTYIDLSGIKYSVNMALLNDQVNFKLLEPDSMASGTATIKNLGTYPLAWKAPIYIGSYFVIDSIKPEITLPAGTSTVYIRFLGGQPESIYSETYSFEDTCKNSMLLNLSAQTKARAILILRIGSDSAYAGDNVGIPVIMENSSKISESGITSFKADLSFNSTILYPTGNEKGTVTNFVRTVPIEFQSANTDGVLAKIPMIACLGLVDSTIVSINNIVPIGGTATITKEDGTFRLLGVCEEGGKRLVNPYGTVLIGAVMPNPVSNIAEIEYQVRDNAFAELYAVNTLGERVLTFFSGMKTHGTYKEKFDLSNLPNGVYMLVLKSKEDTSMQMIQVIK